jgi:hypothetical protein
MRTRFLLLIFPLILLVSCQAELNILKKKFDRNPPVLDAISDQTVDENDVVTINANDKGDDLDADEQALTYECYYDTTIDADVDETLLCSSLTGISFNT